MTAGVDGQLLRGGSRLTTYANFVKVAHTVFALPFAGVGILVASREAPLSWRVVVLAVLAFTAARFAAMGFNRIVDRRYDAANPRTAGRELPSGRMSVREARALVVTASAVFLASAMLINDLTFALSPLALFWILAYSYTKRFTALCHLWLGWALAIAPVGGYLAVTGSWSTPWYLLVLLGMAVACWVTGFDILYSLQDEAFDREHGLSSMTVVLGARRAIGVARTLHAVAITSLACFGLGIGLGGWYGSGVGVAAALLVWEHRLVRVDDLTRLDAAFFTMNGIISAVVLAGTALDVLL